MALAIAMVVDETRKSENAIRDKTEKYYEDSRILFRLKNCQIRPFDSLKLYVATNLMIFALSSMLE